MTKPSSSNEHSIAGQVIGFTWVRILPKLRLFITVPILSRLIGPEGYGTLATVFAFIRIVVNVVSLGMRTSLNVMLSNIEDSQRCGREYWSVVHLVALLGMMVAFVLCVLGPFILKWLSITIDPFYLLIVLPLIPLCAVDNVFQVQIALKYLARQYARIVMAVTWLELALMLILTLAFNVSGVLVASVIGQAAIVGLMLAVICNVEPFVSIRHIVPLDKLKKYFTYGFIVFLTGITSWIVDSSDRLMIASFLDISDLGVYQVSYSMCAHLSDIAVPLYSAIVPIVMVAVAQHDRQKARRSLENMYRLLVLIYAPAVVFLSFTARELLLLLSTKDFVGGAAIVPWVAVGTAIFRLNGINTSILHSHQRPKLILLSSLVASSVNIGINLYAIPRYGIVAAGVSTFAAYCVDFIFLRWMAGHYMKVPMQWAWLLRVAVALLPLWLTVRFSQMIFELPLYRLFISGIFGGGGYFCALILLRCFTREEQGWLLQYLWLPQKKRQNDGA